MSHLRRVVRWMSCLLAAGVLAGPARCEEPIPGRAAALADLRKHDCRGIDDRTESSEIKWLLFGCHSKLPDSAFRKLAAFPELAYLSFISDEVTDECLVQLKNLPKLKTVYINSATITDKGMKSLKELPQLEELMLMRTQVTEKGLADVQGIRGLKKLELGRFTMTPELMERLKQFQHLDSLKIFQTTLSDEQRAELTRALPNLSIR